MHGASVGKFAGRSTANENLRDYVYYVRRDELYFGACHQTGVLIFLRVLYVFTDDDKVAKIILTCDHKIEIMPLHQKVECPVCLNVTLD